MKSIFSVPRAAELALLAFEAVSGLVVGIVAPQFCQRHAPREPCQIPFEFFIAAAIALSLGLPYTHAYLRKMSRNQRLIVLLVTGATCALLLFGAGWILILQGSWKEAW